MQAYARSPYNVLNRGNEMADGLMIPGWTLIAVPIAYHVGVKIIQSWRGAEEHWVTSKDHKNLEEKRDAKCETCEATIAELKRIVVPREELKVIFDRIEKALDDRQKKTHRLRNTLNKIVQRQHLMHVMVVAIGTKVGADEAMDEAVRKYRELTNATPVPGLELSDDDDEVEPF